MQVSAAPDQREHFLAMVAEYLSSWLAGPFDLPASGMRRKQSDPLQSSISV